MTLMWSQAPPKVCIPLHLQFRLRRTPSGRDDNRVHRTRSRTIAYNEDAGNPSLPSKATKMTRKLLFVEALVSFVVSSPFKS